MEKCGKIRELFGPYLYNDVTPVERAAVEEHIAKCRKCANDLHSRRAVLEKLRTHSEPGEMPQRTGDDFAGNVYRRIASDVLKQRSRRVFLRRFVLQPSLAAAALAVVIAIGVFRLQPAPVTVGEPASTTAKADEAEKKELRAALYVEEFLRRQGTLREGEQGYDSTGSELSVAGQPSPDMSSLMRNMLSLDSRRRLEYANFINYSLREHRRALAEYQRLVDDYPDTDAAMEARGEIRAILDTGI
jgi:hypothetical protein